MPGDDVVTLLPRDPDASACRLAADLRNLTKKHLAVIISDTFGRPWRLGLINVAIGAAGIPVLICAGAHAILEYETAAGYRSCGLGMTLRGCGFGDGQARRRSCRHHSWVQI